MHIAQAERMDEVKKHVIWRLWKSGISMNMIAAELGKPPATVFSYLRYHGGIEPVPRRRSSRQLSFAKREEISSGLSRGSSLRQIALVLSRNTSTISREVVRNGGVQRYRAAAAEMMALKRAKRPKAPLLATNLRLKELVTSKLESNWSPGQTSGWLKINFAAEPDLQISHESIYKSLFIQTRGLFKKQLRDHLRTKRKFRHAKKRKVGSRGKIVDGIAISERPPKVEDRAVPGH